MIDLLKQSSLFEGLRAEELREIANVSQILKVKKGDRVFEAGSPAESLFVIGTGEIDLRFKVTYYNAAAEISLDRKSRGEAFGWSALIGPHRYTLSALALQDSDLLQMNQRDIKRLCEENNHLGYVLMTNLAKIVGNRFTRVEEVLIQQARQSLKQKESSS